MDEVPQEQPVFSQDTSFITSIEQIFSSLPNVLASIGWPLLFTALVVYWLWPTIMKMKSSASLSVANNSKRKSVFNEEVKRIRTLQQLDVYKAKRELAEAEATKIEVDVEEGNEEDDSA